MGNSTVPPKAMSNDSAASQQQGGAGTATALAPPPGGQVVAGTIMAIKVSFELDTEDNLRKVFFGLEKDMKGTDPIWTIHFQLQERETTNDTFTSIVTLDVTIDDQALQPAAEAAAKSGLTAAQAAHVLGPAADDAKGTTTGDVDPGDANDTVKGTLKKK
jgi:hypothetical protein